MTLINGLRGALTLPLLAVVASATWWTPAAHADNDNNTLTPNNKRLNDSVFANIYTAQKQNGCVANPRLDGRLVEAARRHTFDVRDNRDVNGDIGSDGSTPQDRANAAGFTGNVAETVAINPALAISGIEILNQWWYDPPSRATMQDCRYTAIGVWSENLLDRSVVVAVYGQPATT
jgi:uncharacterized protein YkwD